MILLKKIAELALNNNHPVSLVIFKEDNIVEEKSSKNRNFNGPEYITATFGLI